MPKFDRKIIYEKTNAMELWFVPNVELPEQRTDKNGYVNHKKQTHYECSNKSGDHLSI